MQVLFDLRPPHIVQLQSQRIDITRVLSVLFFVLFIMISVYNIGYIAYNYLKVNQELADATGQQRSVQDASAALTAEITRLRDIKNKVAVYLEFTREELPAVEVMKALEDALPPQGLKISGIEIRPNNVLMTGSALSDNEISIFAANLERLNYIVTRVDSPVTTKSVLGARQIADFRLACTIRKVLDIAANDPSQQVFTPIEGGSGQ
jgi:cell division protein FtsB